MIQISAKNMFIIWSLNPISIIQIKEYERKLLLRIISLR